VNTRANYDTDLDNFTAMAARGLEIIDRVVVKHMGGVIRGDTWIIPNTCGFGQENGD